VARRPVSSPGRSGRAGLATRALAAGVCALFAACGDEAAPVGASDAADVAGDAPADASGDGAGDVGDAADDAVDAADLAEEAGRTDVLADVRADVQADTGPDALADTGPDALIDTGPDADDPPDAAPLIVLTVNELPATMNGTRPVNDARLGEVPFTLLLPDTGFTLDVLLDRHPRHVDLDTLLVACDVPVGDAEADSNLAARFEPRAAGLPRLRWLVPTDMPFTTGRVTCEAALADVAGRVSNRSTITFDVTPRSAELDPFDPPDTWLVTFSRDFYDIRIEGSGSTLRVVSDHAPDGEADFLEDLRLIGFQGDESGPGAATVEARGQVGVNAIVADWVIDETMRLVRAQYGLDPATGRPLGEDAVQMTVYREGDPGAPALPWDGTFSVHGVGGEPSAGQPFLFGLASEIDVANQRAQDDARDTYGSFTTNAFRVILENPAGRLLLQELLGTPMGEGPFDALIVADDVVLSELPTGAPGRRTRFLQNLELLTKMLAALIAHEMGHSLGLTPCGVPPDGLFAGYLDESWMVANPGCGHIDLPGLNVMQTGASLLAAPEELFGDVRFSPASLAYLRGRLIILPEE
jgi:hypothetical protein